MNNLDLTSCDKEKIHLINSIQGHGSFLAISLRDHKITNVSENLAQFFDQSEDSSYFIGKRLVDLFSLELSTRILKRLKSHDLLQEGMEHKLENGMKIEVHLYSIMEDIAGIEFEFCESESLNATATVLNEFLEKMQTGKTLEEVSRTACQAVRFLSGFERVMIYRFFPPSMYGEVIAEDRIASSQTFLHHRFPATDIPKPARDLYLRNKVRYIHDSEGTDIQIVPPVFDRKLPLDMSDSRLRSVSKIHIEYLKNMGVRGSMSVAIIVDQKLWGIISCHHSQPKYVSQADRRLCLQVGNTLAMIAPLMENLKSFSFENAFYSKLHQFFGEITQESDPVNSMFKKIDQLNALFSSHGVAYITPEKVLIGGVTPLSRDMRAVWEILRKKMTGDTFVTDNLATLDKSLEPLKEQASGILAIKTSPLDDSMLVFTRPETEATILWGGDPRKNLNERQYNGQINPRASFETWTEVVKGTSLPWTEFEFKGARNFRNMVFDSLVRKEQLIEELHGRLKK